MIIKNTVVGPFQCNCRLLVCPETAEAALIDPGDEAPKLLKLIEKTGQSLGRPLQLKYLLHTHAHLDHIAATREIKEALKVPQIWLHAADEDLYRNLPMQALTFGLNYGSPLPVEKYFEDEMDLCLGHIKFSVIHTPGHSPGSICLRQHEDREKGVAEMVYTGDTLFKGSVGRTDLWGGNSDTLFHSIRSRIFSLDDDTTVCPGHGPDSRVGVEKRENPFF